MFLLEGRVGIVPRGDDIASYTSERQEERSLALIISVITPALFVPIPRQGSKILPSSGLI